MEWEVVEHALDEDEGTYRLVIGVFETHQVVTDVTDTDLDAENNGADGGGGEPIYEEVRVQVAEEDFVFASDDERWADRDPEDVAEEQRQIVVEALEARAAAVEQERQRRAAATRRMPGEGRPLR